MFSPIDHLVSQGLPVLELAVTRLARRIGGIMTTDDLRSIGREALVEVARAYDPARSTFMPYVAAKLRYAILDGVRRETHGRAWAKITAVMASERYGDVFAEEWDEAKLTTLEDDQARFEAMLAGQAAALATGLVAAAGDMTMAQSEDPTPEDRLAREELTQHVRGAMTKLPERERALVERHYFGGEAFETIAADLGISKSWASRLHERAMNALSAHMRATTA